jgi:glucosamine--fructose-6-phosphate aminotransferase (isomerizing)
LTAGKFTREEIHSQPEAWQAALQILTDMKRELKTWIASKEITQVVFTGCGSTYYLSLAAAALLTEMSGHIGLALPASELWLNPGIVLLKKKGTLLVAVSRSGETTETLNACREFKTRKSGRLLTLSCYPGCTLSALGDMNIVLPSGMEQSVAQTRAFSTLYLATVVLVALAAGDETGISQLARLPEAGRRLINQVAPLASDLGRNLSLDRFYFLGSGARYGLAAELSLKMKEMTLSHSEPFHFLEFRHGPMSMVTESTLMTGLVSHRNGVNERKVLDEMKSMGARVLRIGEKGEEVAFESELEESMRNILYLPVGQMLAFERSLAKELDPDKPTHLEAVVKL